MNEWLWQTIIRALAAVVIGSLIGSERARHGRAAGMRMHILVCLGACMTSMTSLFVANVLGDSGDVSRIPAQVISGVGFLGAGMIILKNNNMITGLTTAAGVWTTATIGVALGYGYYTGAAVVTVLFLSTIVLFARFERKRKATAVVYLELDDPYRVNEVLRELQQEIAQHLTYQITPPKSQHEGHVGICLMIDRPVGLDVARLAEKKSVVFAVEE